MDLNDRKTIGAASGDDAFHRDCVSGTDDQDISAIVVKLGFEEGALRAYYDTEYLREIYAKYLFQDIKSAAYAN